MHVKGYLAKFGNLPYTYTKVRYLIIGIWIIRGKESPLNLTSVPCKATVHSV